jgi:two-component system cell cycle response regulator
MARILVIEDNAINLDLMTYLLQAHGHQVLVAADGTQGLQRARQQMPDLVICDIQMPGMDGYAVANALRADNPARPVPLIAVTAYAMVGDHDKAIAAGFDAHIAKPIDPQTFVAAIDRWLPFAGVPPSVSDGDAGVGTGVVPESLRAPRPGLHLLMVDDTSPNLEFKRSLLEPAGYEVVTAGSGEAAWALLQSVPVDLVLSDVMMPGMGGFKLLQQLRADPRHKGMPLLFLTSTACDSTSRAHALALGANGYLMRPIGPLELLREIRAALGGAGPG